MVYKVLFSGQSNALGHDAGGPSTSSNVSVWNNVNPLGSNGTAFVTPVLGSAPFRSDCSNNAGLWFCHRLAEETGEPVNLAVVAKDSTSILSWVVSDDAAAVMSSEIIAVWNATGQSVADIFVWQQGEADDWMTYEQYSGYFYEMLAILSNAGVIGDGTRIIIGGLSETHDGWTDFNNEVLRPLVGSSPMFYYADSAGIENAPSDTSHYSGNGLYQLGYDRYWQAITGSIVLNSIESFTPYFATATGPVDATYTYQEGLQQYDNGKVFWAIRMETSECNITSGAQVNIGGFTRKVMNTGGLSFPIVNGYIDNFGATNSPIAGIMVENQYHAALYKHPNSDARSEISQTFVETDLLDGSGKNRIIASGWYFTE